MNKVSNYRRKVVLYSPILLIQSLCSPLNEIALKREIVTIIRYQTKILNIHNRNLEFRLKFIMASLVSLAYRQVPHKLDVVLELAPRVGMAVVGGILPV